MFGASTATLTSRRPVLSWPDALIAAIDRLPGPPGIVYLVTATVAALALHALEWATGVLPLGRFSFSVAVMAAWSIIILAAFDYMKGVAALAAARFRPATDLSEPALQTLVFWLTHMPALAAWLAIPIALVWAQGVRLMDPTFFGMMKGQPHTDTVMMVVGSINTLAIVLSTFRVVSVLLAVAGGQNAIVRLNLFDPRPLFAFSAFTARIALIIAGMTYLFFLAFPGVTRNPFAYGYILLMLIPITLGSFMLPLYSTHSRMVAEKERLESDVRERIQAALRSVHEHMDGPAGREEGPATRAASLDGVGGYKELLATLIMEDEYIQRTPTWPWNPNTFRNVLVTILLPLLVFVAQRLIARLFAL